MVFRFLCDFVPRFIAWACAQILGSSRWLDPCLSQPAEGANSELTLILRQFFAKVLVATESAEFFLTGQMKIWLPSELDPAAFIVLGTCHV
jgi:hypothetical protein